MIKKYLALLIGAFSLISCTITEDVTISENGAVNYNQIIEMPQMAALMSTADLDEKIELNQISNTEFSYYDFLEFAKKKGGESAKNKLEDYSLYKNDLSAIDFMKFRINLRDNFAIEIINRAKSIDEFNSSSQLVEQTFNQIKLKEEARIAKELASESPKDKRKRLKSKKAESSNVFGDNPLSNFSSIQYSFDGKTFVKKLDTEKYLKSMTKDNDLTEDEKNMFDGILKQMKFKYKYTFPKKIKSIDLEDVFYSKDGKSFTKEFSFDEMIKNPEIGSFNIVFED